MVQMAMVLPVHCAMPTHLFLEFLLSDFVQLCLSLCLCLLLGQLGLLLGSMVLVLCKLRLLLGQHGRPRVARDEVGRQRHGRCASYTSTLSLAHTHKIRCN